MSACTSSGLPSSDSDGGANGGQDGNALADQAGTRVDLAVAGDLPPGQLPDLAVAPAMAIGQLCPIGNECAIGLVCLDEVFSAFFPAVGYCTRMCQNDGDCGAGAYCSPDAGGGFRFCVAACGPGDQCGAGRVCTRRLFGSLPLPAGGCLPGDVKARDGSACLTFGDCNRNQGCLRNPFSMPGGMCVTIGCTDGDNRTCLPGGDGVCVAVGNGVNLCLDGCNLTAECRVAERYVCTPIPGRVAKGCLFTAAGPGASCKADLDCGPGGTPWRCLTGVGFPGGYCAGARGICDPRRDETCPFDARCHDPTPAAPNSGDEHCARTCGVDDNCRKAEGYRCLPGGGLPNGIRVCRLP